MKKIVLAGTGRLAREFTQFFGSQVDIIGYLSINAKEHTDFRLPGKLFNDEKNTDAIGTNLAVIAIGSPSDKRRVYLRMREHGYQFPSLVHPSSVVASNVELRDGVIISPMCCVGSNVKFGSLSYVNFSCGIGHDTEIGEFVQVNPGAQIGGFSKIGTQVLVGSGAIIREGLSIGDEAIIGSGSVVFNKVKGGTTVLGNPAKRLRLFD